MPLNDYITRLEGQVSSDESRLAQEKERLALVHRIKANIEATRNSDSSSLNKSYEELRLSGDPARQRLGGFPNYIASPLIDKMLNRSMTEREYGIALNGSIRDIVDHVEKILFMRIIEAAGKNDKLHFALRYYEHFEQNAYRYAWHADMRRSVENLTSKARDLIGV